MGTSAFDRLWGGSDRANQEYGRATSRTRVDAIWDEDDKKEEERKKRLASSGLSPAAPGSSPAPAPEQPSRLPSHVVSTRGPSRPQSDLPEAAGPSVLESLSSRFRSTRPDESALETMGRQYGEGFDAAGRFLGDFAGQALSHPVQTATDIVTAPFRALPTEGKYFSDRIRGVFGGEQRHPEVTGLDAALGGLDIAGGSAITSPLFRAAGRGIDRVRDVTRAVTRDLAEPDPQDAARFSAALERSKAFAENTRGIKQRTALRRLGPGEEGQLTGPAIPTRGFREVAEADPARLLEESTTPRGRSGDLAGPGIPMGGPRYNAENARGQRLMEAELNARSATPEDVNAYRRQRDVGPAPDRPSILTDLPPDEIPFESIAKPRRRPMPAAERAALDERRIERQGMQREMEVGSARTEGGDLKRNLTKLSDDDLIDEYAKMADSQSDDMTRSAVSVRMKEGTGTTGGKGAGGYDPVMVRSNDAMNALGRVSQRQKGMDRLEAELARRKIKVADALWLKHNATDFDPARFPDDIDVPEGGWVDPKTNRPGYAIAGQFGLMLGPGVGALGGAALAPEGKKKEGAMAGAVAGLGLGFAGAKVAGRAMRGAEDAVTAARRAELATPAGTVDRFNRAVRGGREAAEDLDTFEFDRDGVRHRMNADGFVTKVDRRAGPDAAKPYTGVERRGARPAALAPLSEKGKIRADNAVATVAAERAGRVAAGNRTGAIGVKPASTPALERAAGTVATGERKPAPRPGLLSKPGRAYAGLVSEVAPLEKLGRTFDTTNPDRLAHTVAEAQGWGSTARQYIDDEFQGITDMSRDVETDVQGYVKAQRDKQLRAQGAASKSDLTDAELDAAIADGDANPRIKAAGVALQRYYRKLLDLKLNAGVISQEKYDAIVKSEDFYTPFVREWEGEQAVRSGGIGGGKFTTKPGGAGRKMDRLQEARAKTVDPFEQAIIDTGDTFREIGKQRVTNVVAELVEQNPAALQGLVKRINNFEKAGPLARRIETNVGGKPRVYEVLDKDLYEAWASFDQKALNPVIQALSIPKRGVTAGVVLHPFFAALNLVRDMGQASVQQPLQQIAKRAGTGAAVGAVAGAASADADESKALRAMAGAGLGAGAGAFGSQALKNLRAISHIVGETDVYKDFLRSGAVTEGFYPKGALSMRGLADMKVQRGADARKILDELRTNGVSAKDIVAPTRWVDALKYIGTVAERSTRLAKFQELGEAGASRGAQVLGAQDVSLRFSNMGKWTKEAAAMTPFWNAKVQGFDKLGRLLKDPKTSGAAALAITAPSLALWGVNKDDPAYWDTNQYVRNLFWLIPKPQSMRDNDGGNFWYIPKPFEIGYMFASLPERLADFMYLKKTGGDAKPGETLGESVKQMATSTLEGTAPVPTFARVAVEQMVGDGGWDFFRGQPIVDRPDLPAEMQEDERTSSVARLAGKVGVSPQRVDHIVRGLTGRLGNETLDFTSRVMKASGIDDTPGMTSTRPLTAGPFWRNEGTAAEPEIALRRRSEVAEQVYRGAKELEKDVRQRGGDVTELDRYLDAHKAELIEREELQEAVKALDDISSRRRVVRRDRGLSAEQRKEEIAVLRGLAREISMYGVKGMGQPKDVAERK